MNYLHYRKKKKSFNNFFHHVIQYLAYQIDAWWICNYPSDRIHLYTLQENFKFYDSNVDCNSNCILLVLMHTSHMLYTGYDATLKFKTHYRVGKGMVTHNSGNRSVRGQLAITTLITMLISEQIETVLSVNASSLILADTDPFPLSNYSRETQLDSRFSPRVVITNRILK